MAVDPNLSTDFKEIVYFKVYVYRYMINDYVIYFQIIMIMSDFMFDSV